jgi:hypothetical protein
MLTRDSNKTGLGGGKKLSVFIDQDMLTLDVSEAVDRELGREMGSGKQEGGCQLSGRSRGADTNANANTSTR